MQSIQTASSRPTFLSTDVAMVERTTKHLIVFDIDDTLTRSMSIDEELFVRAITEVLGIENINSDWSTYRNVTDSGVIEEITGGDVGKVAAVRDRFVTLLTSKSRTEPFREVPGAKRMLKTLRHHAGFECALATGAWRESALIKLHSAELGIDGLPLATCGDSPRREEIVQMALERAQAQYHLPPETPVTLVGDRPWDLQTATSLQLHFVGVGQKSGAEQAIGDFTDVDGFLELAVRAPARSY